MNSRHAPDQLNRFGLAGEVDVRGLGTSAALEKLRVAYVQTCSQTGDTPLKLAFKLPPGHEQPLRVRVSGTSMDSSIRAVAAAAKLEVDRSGATYRFRAPRESGRVANDSFSVGPDFLARLMGPAPYDRAMKPRDAFKTFGVDLDESTRLSFSGTKLDAESRSAADMAAISGVVALMHQGSPLQQKLSTRVFEVPAGSDLAAARPGGLDPKSTQRLLAEMASDPQVKADTLPSVTMRIGEDLRLNLGGTKLHVKTGAVGLGHQLQTAFTYNGSGGRSEARDSGYAADGGGRLTVQTQPDGSRRVFVVKTDFLDATGRPIRPEKP